MRTSEFDHRRGHHAVFEVNLERVDDGATRRDERSVNPTRVRSVHQRRACRGEVPPNWWTGGVRSFGISLSSRPRHASYTPRTFAGTPLNCSSPPRAHSNTSPPNSGFPPTLCKPDATIQTKSQNDQLKPSTNSTKYWQPNGDHFTGSSISAALPPLAAWLRRELHSLFPNCRQAPEF